MAKAFRSSRSDSMKPKLLAIFALIVVAPLALLVWIGVRGAREQRGLVQKRFDQLLMSRIADAKSRIDDLLSRRETELLRATESAGLTTADLRALVRTTPAASQAMLLDPEGERLHPPASGPISNAEREFLLRAEQIWRDKHIFFRPSDASARMASDAQTQSPPQTITQSEQSQSATRRRFVPRAETVDGGQGQTFQSDQLAQQAAPRSAAVFKVPSVSRSHGWYAWYWGNGVQLLFWRRLDSGHVIGIELNRARLMADVIAAATPAEATLPDGRVRLLDSKGDVVCQWGAYRPAKGEKPRVALRLDYPLHSWRLEHFVSSAAFDAAFGRQQMANMMGGLAALGLVLVGLAVYFYRESSRDLREAAQRVTFVNQVSHELKTPLTNIRMYGELLQENLPDDDERAEQYVGVICSESQRLSRLIGNILTFARKQRDALKLRPALGCVDDAIRNVLDHFRPALESKGVQVSFAPGAPALVAFDADALEQILGNLFSNVEKYAANGGAMNVTSRQDGDRTSITVADRGPGIPEAQRGAVFEPFQRLSDALTEGVSGTGIGLSIARYLARLHGGDVRLVPSHAGACFEVELRTPAAS